MMPNPAVITALQTQADHERLASTSYLAMGHWCEVAHFSGYAEFFRLQAAEETTHAQKILDHHILKELGK